jgi:hypothetical protein
MKSTLVIGDLQIRAGVPMAHLKLIGRLAADTQPDHIVCVGDVADHPTISKYPDGKVGRKYIKDTWAVSEAVEMFETQLARARGYSPRKVITLGNHDERLAKFEAAFPELTGALSDPLDDWRAASWQTVPFLRPITINGVTYSHFFPRSASGRVMQTRNGAPSARAQLVRECRSVTAGHMQGFDYYEQPTSRGVLQSLIIGSSYMHDEAYLGPQGNGHFRGVVLKLFDRPNGAYSLKQFSFLELKRRYA